MTHLKLLNELERIIGESKDPQAFDELKQYLEECFSPDTPSHNISIGSINMGFGRLYNSVNPDQWEVYESLKDQVVAWFEAIGYRDKIKTPQEDRLIGGSEDTKHTDNPYKPIGLILGEMTIEEARRARELARVCGALTSHYVIEEPENKMAINVTLEPLDNDGNTIQDPRPVDSQLNPIEKFSKAESFPYKRN